MKVVKKFLSGAPLLSFQFGFLEWGGKRESMFIFHGKAEIISKSMLAPIEVKHPFTLIPFVGELILLYTLLQKEPRKWITDVGMGWLGMLTLLLIGMMSLQLRIIAFTLPCFIVCTVTLAPNKNISTHHLSK